MVLQEPISAQLSIPKLVGAETIPQINGEIKNPLENFQIFAIDNLSDNDWRKPIVDYHKNPTGNVDRKVKYRALSYISFENDLFKKTSEGILLKCLNEAEAYIAISDVHSGTCGSHQTGHKMKWLLFRQGLYWPSMLKDCIEFAKGCQECQRHSGIQHVPASELHSIVKPWPFRGWALGLIGEIKPASSKNQRYILVGIDYFTKWIEAIPLPNVDQEAVINFIQNYIIYRFGIPETITTDQGSVFTGRKMQEFAQETGFRLLTSTPYYAQANGQVEAANKIIINLIKKHIAQKPRNWHKTLDQVLWACRNSPKESTNTTPFRLTYGHDAVLPVEIHLQSARVQRQMEIPLDHYYQMMSDELIDLDEERLNALEVLTRQKERVAKAYNKRVKFKSFDIGELVWKVILPMDKKDRILGKWSPNWEGPFKIIQVYSNGAYEIEELTPEKGTLGINGKYLKKYKPTLLEVKISAE
ncbi:protein NYNRIN [Trifolium repens]|nr:protein NYNRIN [Trifolium repens]